MPILMLWVSKQILDAVQVRFSGRPLPEFFWWLVAAEAGLAAVSAVLGRTAGYFDALLADRFTRHVSVRVMGHASRLDLASYEDPVFYDKLERARVQATDRIAMIHALGTLMQQFITAASLSISIFWFSPWLLLLLIVAVVPAFLGESHFAFLGYSLNIRQTPARRQLDYLRVLGASKESAKELKLFGLSEFVTGEYARISNGLFDQNVALARRRLWAGAFLSLLSTAGYYAAYIWVIYRTVSGDLSWGTLQFLAGAIGAPAAISRQSSRRSRRSQINRFSSPTWLNSSTYSPRSVRNQMRCLHRVRSEAAFCLSACHFRILGKLAGFSITSTFVSSPVNGSLLSEKRPGQNHSGQTDHTPL